MDPKRLTPSKAPQYRQAWQIPPDKILQVLTLYHAGKSPHFIYQACWPDEPPVVEVTFHRALSTLVEAMDREQFIARVQSLHAGNADVVEAAVMGRMPIADELEEAQRALIQTRKMLEKRLRAHDAVDDLDDSPRMARIADAHAKNIQCLASLLKLRVELAIIRSNLQPPADQPPTTTGQPPAKAVEIILPNN